MNADVLADYESVIIANSEESVHRMVKTLCGFASKQANRVVELESSLKAVEKDRERLLKEKEDSVALDSDGGTRLRRCLMSECWRCGSSKIHIYNPTTMCHNCYKADFRAYGIGAREVSRL